MRSPLPLFSECGLPGTLSWLFPTASVYSFYSELMVLALFTFFFVFAAGKTLGALLMLSVLAAFFLLLG